MEQTGEPVLAGRHVPPISRAVFLIQAFLRRFKAISDGGTYFVGALKRIPIPFNRSGIEFIMQDPGDCPTFKRCPALAGPSPLIAFSGDSGHVQTADVCLKNIFHDRILLFIDHKRLSVTYSFVTGANTGGAYAPAYIVSGILFFIVCFPLSTLASVWEISLKKRDAQANKAAVAGAAAGAEEGMVQ